MARGSVALPQRGNAPLDNSPVAGGPPAGGYAAEYYWRSDAWTAQVPLPVGPLYGPDTRYGTAGMGPNLRPYTSAVVPVNQGDSDTHITDPAIVRAVALPQRGRYGSDSRLVGPFVAGGNRDSEGESGFFRWWTNRRRAPVVKDHLVPYVRGTEIDWLADPSHLLQSRPYYLNEAGQHGYSGATSFSWTANRTVGGGTGSTDIGPVQRKRYDSMTRYQWTGAESQRYEDAMVTPAGRATHSVYQRGLNYRKREAHPQMVGGYWQQLAALAESVSVGSLTESLM